MLKIQEIRELIKLIDQSNIDEFKFEQNGSKITMRKEGKAARDQVVLQSEKAPVAQVSPIESIQPSAEQVTKNVDTVEQKEEKAVNGAKEKTQNYHAISSPMVGTFYAAPSPDSPSYVKVGDKVNEESVVCIVEAMKLMNEIEAEITGEIVEILVENGQLVEYGQELFLVKPE